MNGKASFERSAVVRRPMSSRERGPWTVSSVVPAVTSVTVTNSPSSTCRSIQGAIRRWMRSVTTSRYFVSASRVTVRSAMIPPAALSHCVYTIRPTGTDTSFAQTRLRTRSASRPWTRNLAMIDMSSTPTASRTARCSAAWRSNAPFLPHPCGRAGLRPSTSNHSGYSQPELTPKCAPPAASRSWITDRRTFRAVFPCQVGNAASPNRTPSCSTARSPRNRRVVSCGCVRSTVMPVTSTGGTPSWIHCAVTLPTPPLSRIPSELSPHATKNPRSSGASPSWGITSGVNDSGPQNIVRTPASWSDGKRSIAALRYGPTRSQSGGRLANWTSRGVPSSDQAAATGSNRPTRIPPPSSR